MALYATNRFRGDGATTSYEFNFVGKYIARTHVKVYQEDNATKVRTSVPINDSNFLNDTTLRSLPVTPVGKTLVIYRDTPKPPLVDFVNGSRFTEYNMDLVARQGLFVAMEAMDAGDLDARQQLLDAITVVAGLVDNAKAAISDATAAALAAATSAAGYATQAEAARVAAVAARDAAQASVGNAATSATNAATSATNAGNSATAAAGSASTANTQAGLAGGYAVSASNSASLAATSETNASSSATAAQAAKVAAEAARDAAIAAKNSGQHFLLLYSGTRLTVDLRRCGGKTMIIAGEAREIPTDGINLLLPNTSTVQNIYAYWTGYAIALEYSTTNPQWENAQGYWSKNGDSSRTYVGSARPDTMEATPNLSVRSAFNGPGMMHRQGITTYRGTWNANRWQIAYGGFVSIPADSLEISANVSIMSAPPDRVGDFNIGLGTGSLQLSTNRNSFVNAYHWNGFYVRWTGTRGINDTPQWIEPYADFLAISGTGGAWNTLDPSQDALAYSAWPAV